MKSSHGYVVLERLLAELPDAVEATRSQHGDATVCIDRAAIVDVLAFLREDDACAFEMLSDVTAVDYLGREIRFEMVYHLYSISRNHRLRVTARVPETDAVIRSVVSLYPSANWMEREVFDLYGIRFEGHPDLRRILLYDEFEGHPLRKDYPKQKRQPLIGPRN